MDNLTEELLLIFQNMDKKEAKRAFNELPMHDKMSNIRHHLAYIENNFHQGVNLRVDSSIDYCPLTLKWKMESLDKHLELMVHHKN